MRAAMQSTGCATTSPMLLAHEVARLAGLLPGSDNSQRQALRAIHEAMVPWCLGQADEAAARSKVAEIAIAAFLMGTDLGQPECWMLGLIGALLDVDPETGASARAAAQSSHDEAGLATAVAGQITGVCARIARQRPSSLPLGITPKLYDVVGGDIARRIEATSARTTRNTFARSLSDK